MCLLWGCQVCPTKRVWPESTLDIAVWVKSKMAAICLRLNTKSISLLKQIRDFLISIIVPSYAVALSKNILDTVYMPKTTMVVTKQTKWP